MTECKSARARHGAGTEPRDVKRVKGRRTSRGGVALKVLGRRHALFPSDRRAARRVTGFCRQQTVTATSPSSAQPTLACASKPGERTQCAADTSRGVVLLRSSGDAPCLLGKTWGYDQASVWVSDGCSAEFATAPAAQAAAQSTVVQVDDRKPAERIEILGRIRSGNGSWWAAASSASCDQRVRLFRYLNQLPGEDTFRDHLGNERPSMGVRTSSRIASSSG